MRTIILLLIFVSCGKLYDIDEMKSAKRKYNTSNPEFNSYKQLFEKIHLEETGKEINIDSLPINFEPLKGTVVGVCFYIPSGNEIFIDPVYWNNVNENKKRILILHELGHCVLNRRHKNDRHNGVHLSLMNETVINGSDYNEYYDFYHTELLTRKLNDFINFLNN